MRLDVNKIEKNFLFWKIYDKMCLKLINECVDEDIFFVNKFHGCIKNKPVQN